MSQPFNPNLPIYLQIIEKIKQKIITKNWRAGSRIPSVRELAVYFGVNPNTMQRALADLEEDGLLFTERTAGRFVTDDPEKIERLREETEERYIREFLTQMQDMGFTKAHVAEKFKLLCRPDFGQASDKEENP